MTVHKTAYQTFIGRTMVLTKIVPAIEDTEHNDQVLSSNANQYLEITENVGDDVRERKIDAGLVAHGKPQEAMIPPFLYPIVVKNLASLKGNTPYREILVGDGRPFMRGNREASLPCRIVNQMEFELLRVLMAANLAWLNQGPQSIMNLGPVMAQVYCRWLGDTISRRFELDATERLKVRVISAYFFQCNFIENDVLTEQQKRAMAAQACRAAGVPNVEYEGLLEDLGVLEGAEDYVGALRRLLDTPRLDNFHIGLLTQAIQGTWFGFNGRELACAAVEHPPTFAAMLYLAFAQNSYRKAGLAITSEAFRGQKGGGEFQRNVQLQLGLR
jgi:hypothetical protein